MVRNPLCALALLSVLLVSVPGCAPAGETSRQPAVSADPAMLLPIPNARIPMEGVLSGGQPSQEQFEAAARAGFRTVLNLRTDSEPGFEWEQAAVEGLGMRYVQIPVEGVKGLTRENIERIDDALSSARNEGPVLLHCGSGNRIGAVLALRAAWVADVDSEAALAYGLASGLTRLEPATRELLGLAD